MQTFPPPTLRVALFTDSFVEANGVATLSRQLVEFAQMRELPFLLIRGGERTGYKRDGSVGTLELKRSLASFPLDKNLYFDPFLTRHKELVIEHLSEFGPDLVHMTGPGDLGFLGLLVSHKLRVPLAASWHTNLHEYLEKRLNTALHWIPQNVRQRAIQAIKQQSLRGLMRYYRTARFSMAPNQAMVDLLQQRTGRPSLLMGHGVDLQGFRPLPHLRDGSQPFCIGYVGRLTTEKNVRIFAELEKRLLASGETNYKFLIVGEGGQQKWLEKHLQRVEMTGVLRGQALADAYSRMDAFVFPSLTDTFGLVILEAMASGVPVIAAPEVGSRVGIEDGVSGFLSNDFVAGLQLLMRDDDLRQRMSVGARKFANRNSWNMVFEQLYETYASGLSIADTRRAEREALLLRR